MIPLTFCYFSNLHLKLFSTKIFVYKCIAVLLVMDVIEITKLYGVLTVMAKWCISSARNMLSLALARYTMDSDERRKLLPLMIRSIVLSQLAAVDSACLCNFHHASFFSQTRLKFPSQVWPSKRSFTKAQWGQRWPLQANGADRLPHTQGSESIDNSFFYLWGHMLTIKTQRSLKQQCRLVC